jgi:hypothetical protein
MIELLMLIVVILAILYEVVINPMIHKQMIKDNVLKIGGKLVSMESLSRRDNIYFVNYEFRGEIQSATVKFSLIYNMEWK